MICYITFNRYNQLNQEENKTYNQGDTELWNINNKLYRKTKITNLINIRLLFSQQLILEL